jgi:hypothetical protein
LAPQPGPRHQGESFNLERSGRGRPGTFQVWAPQTKPYDFVWVGAMDVTKPRPQTP